MGYQDILWHGQGSREGANGTHFPAGDDPEFVGNTRTPQASFVPYLEPAISAFRVDGIVLTLDTDNGHLFISLDSSETADDVIVDIDLVCATSTPSPSCINHSP